MKELNNWHPYPRYGVAAALALKDEKEIDWDNQEHIKELLINELDRGLGSFMLMREHVPTKDFIGKVSYKYMSGAQVDPGKKSGQISDNGYYTGPHVLTGNNAADIVKEIKAMKAAVQHEKFSFEKPYELKRSFAPLVAKLNSGKNSMSNPKVGILRAAFTVIATLTDRKAATYTALKGGGDAMNVGLIPDLPYYDEKSETYPMGEYVDLLHELMISNQGENIHEGRFEKKFYRPKIFTGNYPNAPSNSSLGAASLLVAMGEWVKEGVELAKDARAVQVRSVLEHLVDCPLYLISNAGTKQETFRHHLIDLTVEGQMKEIVQGIYRTRLLNVDPKEKETDPKVLLFRMMADRFLRLLTPASFKDFLAFRAEYPQTLIPIIQHYMKHNTALTPELIASARAYGASLNTAAYQAALSEVPNDPKDNNSDFSKAKWIRRQEVKDKVLSQFESTIRSARSGTELLSRLSTRAGRITKREISVEAIPFMEAAALGDAEGGIDINTAQELITAFMRVKFERTNSESSKESDPSDN